MEVIRKKYLDWLESWKDQHFIKIITGIRRSGKSTILKQYKNSLSEKFKINNKQIQIYDFNDKSLVSQFSWESLTNSIISKSIKNKINYLFLDEIQEIKKFEKCVITLFEHKKIKYDIVITGSNSKLFSDELATFFTGRHIDLDVYPFSFNEFMEYLKINNMNINQTNAFDMYVQFGGLPIILNLLNNEEKIKQILNKVLDDVVNKDVLQRHRSISNASEFKRIANFIFDNNAKQTSTLSIMKKLNTINKSFITDKTVDSYIKWMIDANLIYRSDYYDIRGKRLLETTGRYFAVDIGIRNANVKFNRDMGFCLENIAFLEFKRMGCKIYGQKISNGAEIDFVVEREKIKKYIQVTEKITKSNQNSEIGNLILASEEALKNGFEKIVLTLNNPSSMTDNGVRIINLIDWLLGKEVIDI